MIRPTLDEAKEFSKNYKVIPLCVEIYADMLTPMAVLKALKEKSNHRFLLESVEDTKKWGRYTFLGFDPKMEITCLNGEMTVKNGNSKSLSIKNPGEYISQVLKEHKAPRFDYLPPFTGGLVGYFSYDYIKYTEPTLKLNAKDEENFKDVDLMLFDKIIAFDNLKQKVFLIANIKTDGIETEYEKGAREIQDMLDLIKNPPKEKHETGKLRSEIKGLFTKDEYCKMIERTKHYIKEGDIFQAVLSNRFEAEFEGSLLDAYRVLRTTNPSPYMFYFTSSDIEIMGASPETLVKLQDGTLYTFPLAGSRPRGATDEEDLQLEKELLQDPKELSEHNMLVDLGRNDIGKVSKFGTVEVEKYLSVLKFSHIMHIGSTVTGQIREDMNAMDAINAVLPAGTLSGAPKIRACQIINELENNKRGIYGGAIGYLDFNGNMDTCIAIRLAFKKNNKVFIRSGAGIVADSVAEKEYEECGNKARAVINALKSADGGIDNGSFN